MARDDLAINEIQGNKGGEAAASQYAAMLAQMQQGGPAAGGAPQEGVGEIGGVQGVNTQDSTSFSPEAAAAAQEGPEAEGDNTSSLIAGLSETFDSQTDPDSQDPSVNAGGIAGSEAAAAAGKGASEQPVDNSEPADKIDTVNDTGSASEQQNLSGPAPAQVPGIGDAHAGMESQRF